MAPSERTNNMVPSVTAKSNAGDNADVIVWADPATHRLLVNASVTVGAVSGSKTNNNAAPAGDNLGVLPAVANAAAPTYSEGNQVLLSTDLSGNLRVTGSLSVGGTTDGATFTAGSSTGTPTMGAYHSVIDTVTDGKSAIVAIDSKRSMHTSPYDAAGNALLGQKTTAGSIPVALASDATLPVTNAGTFAVQATLAAETTKVIGVVRTSDGAGNLLTSNSTTPAAHFALDTNITSILGTAPTTVGKLDIKGADGDVFVRQATGTNLHMVVDSGTITTVSTVTAVTTLATLTNITNWGNIVDNAAFTDGTTRILMAGFIFDEVAGTALSENDGGAARIDSKRALIGVIEDATTRGQRMSVTTRGSIPTEGPTASGSAVAAAPLTIGARGATANPTAVADGQAVNAMADKLGRQVVVVGQVRDLKANQITTITASTAETTVVTAVASTFLDVYGCIIVNSSITATNVTFKDSTAGTTQFNVYVPAGETRGFMLPSSDGFKQTTVNTAWTATSSASVTSLIISMLYVKNL